MATEMNKTYNPSEIEDRLYKKWLDKKYFHAEVDRSKKPFTIVMPPPNITGQLHMGHALDNTLQDILIRFKRMQGYNALWQPGTDHASIATEVKVTNKLREEGIDKEELGREGFLKRTWEWREEYGGRIVSQLKKLGSSADWDRERFTMDEGCSKAVQEVFIRLYEKGYIYQGSRIINWCPVCQTSISDAEVEYEDQAGHFWHINYPIVGTDKCIEIATTRPETMLGDTAIAVHPDDERYKDLVGKMVLLPIVNKEIPIVADSYVDKEFGTGAVKITPAHDPNDFEVGKRHNLEEINILNDDGTINENGGKFEGMDRYEARKAIVKELEEGGYLVRIENHEHNVGTHDRCHTTVEPMVKKQWFVKMNEMAKPAIEAVKNGDLRFVPGHFDRTYLHWLENIRDWCISRQLWWGHRIPAYYCDDCGEIVVAKETPSVCPKCGCTHFTQDEDTLDTWFSSALWPFSTLGWPEQTEDFKYFYPTDTLVTGYDIIFFWVARMIFSAIEHTGKAPFKNVFIHGIVRDSQGRKMSKSLGNGIDPIEVIDKYGTDALRFSLILGISPGNDIRYMPEKLEAASNFANKLWNASKFVLGNLENYKEIEFKDIKDDLTYADKWILSKLNVLVAEITNNIDGFELGVFAQKIYDFIWNEFCDWYIEMVKPRLYNENDKTKLAAMYTLNKVLADSLKLLHPIMPFITEEIYTKLYNNDESIMISKWPEYDNNLNYEKEIQAVEELKNIIIGIRNIRVQRNVHPSKKSKLIFVTSDLKETVKDSEPWLLKLGFGSEIQVKDNKEEIPQNAMAVLANGVELYMPFEELVDIVEEKERLQKEKERLQSEIQRATKMLSNPGFVNKAPAEKIQEEKDKKAKYEDMLVLVESRLLEIGNKS